MVVVVILLGVVALLAVGWCALHARREVLRRRQVARVRAALEPRTTVAELRERCGADELPRYPTPAGAGGTPDTSAPAGPTPAAADRDGSRS